MYQLQGGIERYLQEFPDGGYWQGKNYVFDKREAIGVGCFEGVGGVIKKPNSASAPADADAPQNKKKKRKRESDAAASHNEEILGKCCACKAPWDRYIGKKKCSMCAVPVLLCERCCTNKVDKTPGNELLMRCELCVAENCTVPVSEVQITKNGTAPKWSNDYSGNFDEEAAAKVIAKTVCKWGGGHAQKKKEERQKQREDKKRQRLQQMPCKYGATCNRKDCWFSHTGQYPTDY